MILWGSLLLGGLPYVIFLAGLLHWTHSKNAREFRRVGFLSPVLFALFFAYCYATIMIPLRLFTSGTINFEELLSLSVLTLIFGYCYVLAVNVLYYGLQFLGFIIQEDYSETIILRKTENKRFIVPAVILLLPILAGAGITLFRFSQHNKTASERIVEANKLPPEEKERELVQIIRKQTNEQKFSEAKATVSTHIQDKNQSYAGIVTAQVESGFLKEAKETADLITAPTIKIMAYCQISEAQAQFNDKPAAKDNLKSALEIALKKENKYSKQHDLKTIIYSQARCNLDEEIEKTLINVDVSEIIEIYQTIGEVKAEIGQSDKAREYFQKAIDKASTLKDQQIKDGKLSHISDAQAEAELYDDAIKTSEMIVLAGYKAAAQSHISEMKKRVKN